MNDLSVKDVINGIAFNYFSKGNECPSKGREELLNQLVKEVESYKAQNEGLWDALARKEVQAEKVVPLEKQLERMIEVAEELNYRLAKTKQPEGFYGDIERSKELLGEYNATN